jgi:hypothetical protein
MEGEMLTSAQYQNQPQVGVMITEINHTSSDEDLFVLHEMIRKWKERAEADLHWNPATFNYMQMQGSEVRVQFQFLVPSPIPTQ